MKSTLLVLTLLGLCGCSTRTITLPGGVGSYKSMRLGNKEAIKHIEFTGTDGSRLVVDGFSNDQVEAMGVITEAAVKAAMSSVVPTAAVKSEPPAFKVPEGYKLVPKNDPSKPHLEIAP